MLQFLIQAFNGLYTHLIKDGLSKFILPLTLYDYTCQVPEIYVPNSLNSSAPVPTGYHTPSFSFLQNPIAEFLEKILKFDTVLKPGQSHCCK